MEQQLAEIKQLLGEIKAMLQSLKSTDVEQKDSPAVTSRFRGM